MITLFCGAVVLLGLATAAVVGARTIASDDPQGNSALFLLAQALDGSDSGRIMFAVAACAVFVTALATVAGLALAAAASLSHDICSWTLRKGAATDKAETAVARWAIVAIGVTSVFLSVLLHAWSILFLASFAAAVAASVILPALVYTLFWQGFTRRGLLWTLYGSLACCLLLQFFSPTVSGQPYSLLPKHDFHWFPLQNIALVTVPVGFLLGWAGSRIGPQRRAPDDVAQTRMPAGLD